MSLILQVAKNQILKMFQNIAEAKQFSILNFN